MSKLIQRTTRLFALGLVVLSLVGLTACASTGGSDAEMALADSVRSALEADDVTGDYAIEVIADGGTIILRGRVKTPEARFAASDIARDVPGVEFVRNEIRIQP